MLSSGFFPSHFSTISSHVAWFFSNKLYKFCSGRLFHRNLLVQTSEINGFLKNCSCCAGNDELEFIHDASLDDVLDEEPDFLDEQRAAEDDSARVPPADIQLPITRDELIEAQREDAFCQTILTRQSETQDAAFFEGHDGLLRRRNPHDEERTQIVVPASLRPWLLELTHHHVLAGHPGQTRMYYTLRRTYYWPCLLYTSPSPRDGATSRMPSSA